MLRIIFVLLPIVFAKDPGPEDLLQLFLEVHNEAREERPVQVKPKRETFVQPKWNELSERELKMAVDGLSADLDNAALGNIPAEPLLKTLLKLISESDTPSKIRKMAAEGVDRLGSHRLKAKEWEDVVRNAITNPHCAGEVRAILARALSRWPLKPEQVEVIQAHLNDPKQRDAAMSFLAGLEDRAKPFMEAVRPRLNHDYNAQRVLAHVGGEEARRFFENRLDPKGIVDPETVKAFTDRDLLNYEELQLLTPLLGKKSLGISTKAHIFKRVLNFAPLGSVIDQLEKFIEDALMDGDEDLLVALDEKILPLVLERGSLAPGRILSIFIERLPHEKDPLKRAVMLNHLNAFLKGNQSQVTEDPAFISYLEKASKPAGPKPTKEEFVAGLALIQLEGGFDFGKGDGRLSDYLKNTPNKARALSQISQISARYLAILPATAKIVLETTNKKELSFGQREELELVEGVLELHGWAGDLKNFNHNPKAAQFLQDMVRKFPSAMTDQTLITLEHHLGLPQEEVDRFVSLTKSADRTIAEKAFKIAVAKPKLRPKLDDEAIDIALTSKDHEILETAIELLLSKNRIEKLTELVKSADERTRVTAFKKSADFYDLFVKLPREIAVEFLESSDLEAANHATRHLVTSETALSEQELAKVIANIPRDRALASTSIWALTEHSAQLKEVPEEVLKMLPSQSEHFIIMNLIKRMGKRAENAVPELTKLVERGKFDQYVGKALVSIGEPAKVAIPRLREIIRTGNQTKQMYALNTLHAFGEDVTSAVPFLQRTLVNGETEESRLTAAELLVKQPNHRKEGVRGLLLLTSDIREGIVDFKINELWNSDFQKDVVELLRDPEPNVAKIAERVLQRQGQIEAIKGLNRKRPKP